MSIWVLDAICALVFMLGVALALKQPVAPRNGRPGPIHANDNPQTYILRITGVTMATFGLALGLMATVYHLA